MSAGGAKYIGFSRRPSHGAAARELRRRRRTRLEHLVEEAFAAQIHAHVEALEAPQQETGLLERAGLHTRRSSRAGEKRSPCSRARSVPTWTGRHPSTVGTQAAQTGPPSAT